MNKYPLYPIDSNRNSVGYIEVTNDISDLLDEGYFFVVAPIRNAKSEVVALTIDPITIAQADTIVPTIFGG